MRDYERPVAFVSEGESEGVFAASGSITGIEKSDCWTVTVKKDQDDAGGYCTFRVEGKHSPKMEHISTATYVTIQFNGPVKEAQFENFESRVSGNYVYLTRRSHANGYKSGDTFNSLLKIWTNDDSYKVIQALDSGIKCEKSVNVQGGGADGN